MPFRSARSNTSAVQIELLATIYDCCDGVIDLFRAFRLHDARGPAQRSASAAEQGNAT